MGKKIGSVLKEARLKANMSVKDISEILTKKGYKASEKTIYSWENSNSQPSPDALLEMCDIYQIKDILLTFGYNGYKEDGSIQLNINEVDLIEKYRFILEYSPEGIETVNYILNRERRIAEQIRNGNIAANTDGERSNIPFRIIQYFQSVSAGTGQVIFDDVYSERITIPDIPEYRRVAYAVKVSGYSMEPLYKDGDMLLIEPTCSIDIGEIGIFNVNGQAYVKKLGDGEIISLNTGYGNVTLTDDSRCMGRVVDRFVNEAE